MRESYEDLHALSPNPPTWFDEHGVPRFCEFSPQRLADIYASECALVLIKCQCCETEFHIAMSSSEMHRGLSTAAAIRSRELEYGDPPNTGCCPAGATMNSVPHRVIEFWQRKLPLMDWTRDALLEVEILPDWASE
ncbi:MAG: hypothetical protein JWO51_175 [Rhodospirillales bacterium]|nr:hypothetical protein [Rhodospirillales bacterium]